MDFYIGDLCEFTESDTERPIPDPSEITASLTAGAYTPLTELRSSFRALPRDIRVLIYLLAGVNIREPARWVDLAAKLKNGDSGNTDKRRWVVARQLMVTCKCALPDLHSPSRLPKVSTNHLRRVAKAPGSRKQN